VLATIFTPSQMLAAAGGHLELSKNRSKF